MSFRRNRKFKEKPAVFAFGHIMLPLVAILAVGLLILGVRLLFMPPESPVSYPENLEYHEGETPSMSLTAEPVDNSQVVAVPAPGGDEPVTESGTAQAEPAAEGAAPTSTRTGTETKIPMPAQASRGSWVVQIGAFSLKESAETLVGEVRDKNFNAYVTRAEVGGKTYYRVRVPAGDQKVEADNLARELASKGYPTLVTKQE
ncbi:MAG: SPOR domain-containing protein [Thermovirga sp.]|nr:SPOR domain-containing protein [Thermovirga sp.]